ncbi:hypothetical protein HKBW3S44_00437 [Candidatus Hakubella thermalkaliphila]|uniref:DNA translocase FtsK 4TM region domain-containing protein n=1 Tax=Candidatus Hakubella thermalkaliphila TaxID=2754717 RepID=A0A6V8Q069_9ACTN|nr:DNA translocase FtsK 4TM domain-containing protein [Candidatus Hakubella thermalkaliphila]GFP36756.1 hypothetical protein HKBW3S44_00437 [Candidatus Hakubella thermalkaliphila]
MSRTTKYRKTARRTKANPSRGRPPAKSRSFLKEPGEFYGIFLFFLALLATVSLFSERAGVLGKWIDEGLTISFGRGAYFVPVLLLVWALSFFAHTRRYNFNSLISGLALAFISLLALAGIIGAEPGTIFEQSQMVARGGLCRSSFGLSLNQDGRRDRRLPLFSCSSPHCFFDLHQNVPKRSRPESYSEIGPQNKRNLESRDKRIEKRGDQRTGASN